jgi:hypothetical protein
VIILDATNGNGEKAEFIKGFKQELKRKGTTLHVLKASASQEELKAALRLGKTNIFVPTSGSNLTLIKLLPQLKLLVRNSPEMVINSLVTGMADVHQRPSG